MYIMTSRTQELFKHGWYLHEVFGAYGEKHGYGLGFLGPSEGQGCQRQGLRICHSEGVSLQGLGVYCRASEIMGVVLRAYAEVKAYEI